MNLECPIRLLENAVNNRLKLYDKFSRGVGHFVNGPKVRDEIAQLKAAIEILKKEQK